MTGTLRGKVGPARPEGEGHGDQASCGSQPSPANTMILDPRPPDSTTAHFCGFRHPCLQSCVSTAPGNGCRSPQLPSGFHCVITRPQRVQDLIIPTPKATGGPGMGDAYGTTEHGRSRAGPSTLVQRLHLGVFLPSPKSSMGKCSQWQKHLKGFIASQ